MISFPGIPGGTRCSVCLAREHERPGVWERRRTRFGQLDVTGPTLRADGRGFAPSVGKAVLPDEYLDLCPDCARLPDPEQAIRARRIKAQGGQPRPGYGRSN